MNSCSTKQLQQFRLIGKYVYELNGCNAPMKRPTFRIQNNSKTNIFFVKLDFNTTMRLIRSENLMFGSLSSFHVYWNSFILDARTTPENALSTTTAMNHQNLVFLVWSTQMIMINTTTITMHKRGEKTDINALGVCSRSIKFDWK